MNDVNTSSRGSVEMANSQVFRHEDCISRDETQLGNGDRTQDSNAHIWTIERSSDI